MRTCLVVAFLAAVVVSAGANSITIGQIQFLGTNPQGVSAFKVSLNTTGVTASALTLHDLTLIENGIGENTGTVTSPVAILFLGGPGFRLPACPCESAQVKLSFATQKKTITLQLANGEFFVTRSTPIFVLRPLANNRFLTSGQSEAIVLTSVPEPTSFALFSVGLALLLYQKHSS